MPYSFIRIKTWNCPSLFGLYLQDSCRVTFHTFNLEALSFCVYGPLSIMCSKWQLIMIMGSNDIDNLDKNADNRGYDRPLNLNSCKTGPLTDWHLTVKFMSLVRRSLWQVAKDGKPRFCITFESRRTWRPSVRWQAIIWAWRTTMMCCQMWGRRWTSWRAVAFQSKSFHSFHWSLSLRGRNISSNFRRWSRPLPRHFE